MQNRIWTIGHSTRSIEEFTNSIKYFGIKIVADVRRYPGSKKYPHFIKENMEKWLPANGFMYIHFENLGGRRKVKINSENDGWRLAAFRGYADYMETENYKNELLKLMEAAALGNLVFMCSEAVWWSCHRSLISDDLKCRGWEVIHIMKEASSMEHPFTKPARIVNDKLVYSKDNIT